MFDPVSVLLLPRTVRLVLNDGGTCLLAGNEIVINVGSRAAVSDIPGRKVVRALIHIEVLELDYLPSRVIVARGRLCRRRDDAGFPPVRQLGDDRRARPPAHGTGRVSTKEECS